MATIIDKPDALSLSGNMRKFVLGASGPVSLTLKKGETVLIERSYEPGADGMITIDARDVVENQLFYTLDTANAIYSQHSILGDFTAIIDGESLAFRAIRSGVANLADTPANWLGSHFLTWQPKVKDVTYYSPEWLTYYAVSACSVKVKATFQDKSTNTTLLKNMDAGECVTLNLQYAVISRLFGNRYPIYFEVWAETGGLKLTESQFYKFSDTLSEDEQWFLFENSLGGMDTFRAYGVCKLQAGHEHLVAELGDSLLEYDVDTERAYTKNTGHLDGYARRWLLDFFPSRGKYVHEAAAIRKIVVTESDASYSSSDLPSSFTFTYRIADRSKLLNLTRNEGEIPSNLVIPDTGTPDFIFPPRLAEFPRIDLGEGVLFPAFDPHNPKPTVSSFGQIHDTIKNSVINELEDAWRALSNLGDGGGGEDDGFYHVKLHDLTEPTDENGFTALRTLKEINDSLVEADGMFLRKDIDDIAHGMITFERKTGSTVFIDGWDGEGWEISEKGAALLDSARIKSDLLVGNKLGSPSFASGMFGWGTEIDMVSGRAEVDNLMVRKEFQVNTLVVNETIGINGNRLISDCNKILSVEVIRGRYRCHIDKIEGMMYMNLRTGDIVRCQQFAYLAGRYYYGRVITVTEGYFDLDKPLMEGRSTPEPGDVVFRMGNLDNPDRQGALYMATSDSHAPYIDVLAGMTSADMTDKTAVRMGNMAGIRSRRRGDLSGYGIYIRGGIFEECDMVMPDGSTIYQTFEAMDGKLTSSIEGLRSDMYVESGNILRNSAFNKNLHYWTTANNVHLIELADVFLWGGDTFYAEKEAVADIYNDSGRNVLRVRNTHITQPNEVMRLTGHTEGPGEGLTYSFALYAKAIRPGTLSAGIPGTSLYLEQAIPVSEGYQKIVKVGKWNEKGDFQIRFSGEILIYGVSLFNDRLADAQILLQTQIDQTTEYIKLLATKEYVDGETGEIYAHYDSRFQVTAEQISGVSTKVDNINDTIDTAGWITKADGNTLFATKELEDGDRIISYINQTATTTTISARRIDLFGAVTFNMFDPALTGKINGKADSSGLGDLAYQDSVYSANLAKEITDSITAKVSPDQLRNYAFATGSQISKSDLMGALQSEINAKLEGSASPGTDKLASVIINGQSLIAGGYIQTNLINVDELWCTRLRAVEGYVAGFDIVGKSLRAESGPDSLSLSPSGIAFSGEGLFSGLGPGSAPGTFGVDMGAWIMVNKAEPANYGMAINVYGASDEYGNTALLLQRGCIAGFRMKTRRISSHYSMEAGEGFISCYNTGDIDLYLPFKPEVGDMKVIRRNNEAGVRILAVNYRIMRAGAPVSNTWLGEGEGDMAVLFFDGQYWSYNYMGR